MGDGAQGAAVVENASEQEQAKSLVAKQRQFFESGATLPFEFRMERLRALSAGIKKNEQVIFDALYEDLRRPKTTAYFLEVGYMTQAIRHTLKHLGSWMSPKSSWAPIVAALSRSSIHYQPLGVNLIIAPWNYPVQLAIAPLAAAVAAGNTAIVKPSELAPASSAAVAKIIREVFSDEHVAAMEGGVDTSKALLEQPFDHFFFTGGTNVGRIVAHAAADRLARATLELGGKSPTIVRRSANLDVAAKRIVNTKFINAGQTCIAPDYLLIDDAVYDEFLDRVGKAIREFYGTDPQQSEDYARIINRRHFDRVSGLIDEDKVMTGGETDANDLYIAPTVMRDIGMDDKAMAEEIFGPVLPALRIKSLEDAIEHIRQRPNPLALYLFTENPDDERSIVDRVSFGGGCINNAAYHFLDEDLPFGGIGASGLGAYHGRHGFEAFSHKKAVMKSPTFLNPSLNFPPWRDKLKIIRRLVR